eukprot:gnl/Hemi2/19546_TR6496_c0_g1_i1.p1 gnl/Hemi2/19546_TR6496_c0_g1~~gnl/Hemi2/19546_TR6496_c0_g1_i1.p1  ORF type:complete len:193 (+),score=89.21 gnl/Hemi2/19546_TR6496_c0_g1_i1:54-581(+)
MRGFVALLLVFVCLNAALAARSRTPVAKDKADVGFQNAAMKVTTNDTKDAVKFMKPLNYTKPCNLPFQLAAAPFDRPVRCAGCLATLSALLSFMHMDMNILNPQQAQYEFNKACMYVESDYMQTCQYMYNVHGRHVVSYVLQNKVPISICSCINMCDQQDVTMYTGAFQAGGASA